MRSGRVDGTRQAAGHLWCNLATSAREVTCGVLSWRADLACGLRLQEAAEEMVQILHESEHFSAWDETWAENPLPVGTEREMSCMSRGEPIFRAVFTRV
jgi:hypothetical protein